MEGFKTVLTAAILVASQADAAYLQKKETVLWRNTRLEDVKVLTGKMDGGWIGKTFGSLGVIASRTNGAMSVQFQCLDGYCKAVKAELVQRGADVAARVVRSGYTDAGRFGRVLPESVFSLEAATCRTNGTYGVHDVAAHDAGCAADATWQVSTPRGELTVDAIGGFAFKDRRNGRVYRTLSRGLVRVDEGEVTKPGTVAVKFTDCLSRVAYEATYELDDTASEIVVTVRGRADLSLPEPLAYPAALATEGDDRLVLPISEGLGVPAHGGEKPVWLAESMKLFRGGDFAMPFWGAFSDASGAGWMAIVETPDDAAIRVTGNGSGYRTFGPEWMASRAKFAYERRIRYVFLAQGGHVAACKRYRAYARSKGLLKTFAEKRKTRPAVERLPGAVNIWDFRYLPSQALMKEFQSMGADHILYNGGDPEFLKGVKDDPQILTSCYDDYRDMYTPEQLKKLGMATGVNVDAWPDGAVWNSADSNDWRRAWGVKAADGSWTYCATLCDKVARDVMRRHVAKDQREYPRSARFVDVAAAADWDECENPSHPMDRRESRKARVELLRAMGEEFNLVVGSEQGHDAVAAVCDYFEGMMSPAAYRVPDSGRDLVTIWTNVPDCVAEVQVNEKVRLPLWELVYHDCVCAHWYWGDYSNKIPATWDRRDMLNVLYGTAPMFLLVNGQWPEEKPRFEKTCRDVLPIVRRCGFSEMTDHRILSADRSVQRTVYANGVTVTVNFGPNDWKDPVDGQVVAAGTWRVQ